MKHQRHTDPLPLGGDGIPYSKGLMARTLIATGMRAVRAYELARRIDVDLSERGEESIELERVHELAVSVLGQEESDEAMRRLRQYEDLRQLELPIIVLVGGGTGTGKSTLATEVAYRLGISRVTSTDFVRQTMRAFFSTEFMPSVHYSSFEAGRAVTGIATDQAVAGFLEQTRNVLVGVAAAMERALEEGWSMVLEGVHLVPGMLPSGMEDALFVPCVLKVEDEQAHADRFWVRDMGSDGKRPLDRYLEGFEDIRAIQSFIVERAAQHDVPVIDSHDPDRSVVQIMELVLAGAERMRRVPAD
jgi:2-phosphoglycerate kinase